MDVGREKLIRQRNAKLGEFIKQFPDFASSGVASLYFDVNYLLNELDLVRQEKPLEKPEASS